MNNTMHNTESMMAAIDGITLPIILLDRMGAICNFNLGASRLFGITAKHAVGKNINALCSVVAEGVENKAQLNSLRSYNCQVIQGFIYSKAVLADEISNKLKGGELDPCVAT